MDHFLSIVIFFIFFILTQAQTDSDNSVTKTSWFWPLLGICLALLFSIPCTLIIIVIIYYVKHRSDDDSDGSSIHSNSSTSSSSVPVQRERRRQHAPPQRSHHATGFRSPPPPYTTNEQPQNLFMTPSLPPPYDSHVNDNIPTNPSTVTNIQPTENIENSTVLDVSESLASPSMQTFQA